MALVLRTVNSDFQIEDRFLTLIPVKDGTAKTLHGKIIEYFTEKGISYKSNMLGYACDGANVMFGGNHSLVSLLKSDIPNLFTMKYIYPSFSLCASYACEKLPRGVEDFCRKVFNHINVKPHKLLHPCQTRWLSLI